MWIMVSGPYSAGEADAALRSERLSAMNEAALAVFRLGHIPIIGVNMALPVIQCEASAYAEVMMPLSLALAERCDAVLRLPGESDGADQEVDVIRAKGGRVFQSLDEIQRVDPT
jgi:hypothetical protein